MQQLVVGVDIGGTKILAGEVTADGRVTRLRRVPVPGRLATSDDVDDALSEAVEQVARGREVSAVGLSVAGLVSADRTVVRFATHLPWREDPTASRLAARWGLPVVMDNDVACAAVAELQFGAGRGVDSFLLVTVGTGLGGALVHHGGLVRGANGMAGELGHVRVVPDGRPCECGMRGCLEQYASGNALVRLAGPDYEDGPAVTAAAGAGDTAALRALAEVGHWLGVGIAGVVSVFDPALVIIGGGVSEAGELLLTPARRAMGGAVLGSRHRDLPALVLAGCGPAAGAVGAAHVARVTLAG